MAITLGNFFTSNGRTVVGGISGSGLDTQGLIKGLVDAKELPKLKLEDRIELNKNKTTAYTEFRSILSSLKDAVNFIRNPPGVQNDADNVFKYRSATLSSSSSISASSYLSVSAVPGASIQNYNVSEVTSLAKAAKQKTGTFAIANANTSVVTSAATPGFFKAGTATVNGAEITLEADDTLNQVVAKFNEVKATTGIEASIIQVATGQFTISFTATSLGTEAAFNLNDSGTVTADADGVFSMLGRTNLLTNGTFATNITGWTDASLGAGSVAWDAAGSMALDGDGAGGNEAFAQQAMTTEIGQEYTVTMTLADLTSSAFIRIGSDGDVSNPANFDVEDFEVAADGTVSFTFTATSTTSYLTINSGNNTDAITVDNISVVSNADQAVSNTQTASDAVFVIDGITVSRSSNSITDVIDGLTINLLQATPPATEIDINIEADTELPASGVINFINSFNALRIFVAEQSQTDDDGTFSEEAYLAGETLLRTITSALGGELSSAVSGAGAYDTLAKVGITFADLPESEENPFTRNILNMDEEAFAAALADDFESVEKLFGFSSTTTNANVAVYRSSNNTSVTSFTLNIDPDTDTFEATYGSTTVQLTATAVGTSGYTLTGPSGSALEGMTLIYAATTAGTATVTISQGIADRIFNSLEGILDEQEGQLQLQLNAIEEANTRFETQITRIDEQVERYREQLLARFGSLESLLSSVNTLLASLDAQQAAINNS